MPSECLRTWEPALWFILSPPVATEQSVEKTMGKEAEARQKDIKHKAPFYVNHAGAETR